MIGEEGTWDRGMMDRGMGAERPRESGDKGMGTKESGSRRRKRGGKMMGGDSIRVLNDFAHNHFAYAALSSFRRVSAKANNSAMTPQSLEIGRAFRYPHGWPVRARNG
jgi:hypothetical protein